MITKVSEIKASNIADYIRLVETSERELNELETFLKISKDFIKNYTGLTELELDNYSDFVIVTYILCQDMYDNRTYYVEKTNLNKMVETILGMHSVNLL